MRRVYLWLLRFYPREYRAAFAGQMLATFDESAAEYKQKGWGTYVCFAVGELFSLATGAAREWIVNPTTPAMAGEGVLADLGERLPGPVTMAEQRIADLRKLMTHAIANHDFVGARRYSYEELREQENLRVLRERYGGE
jgi:hypothetical protein